MNHNDPHLKTWPLPEAAHDAALHVKQLDAAFQAKFVQRVQAHNAELRAMVKAHNADLAQVMTAIGRSVDVEVDPSDRAWGLDTAYMEHGLVFLRYDPNRPPSGLSEALGADENELLIGQLPKAN